MSKRQRRHPCADEKVALLRLHVVETKPVSDICEEYRLNPNVFYRWQKAMGDCGSGGPPQG
ncbi:MAG: hypothetical protein D6820_18265 [Lentisphaerae bacterium]|nr:MAG: hypothetical protein D6820_18265 [Lentisphaerota bacterium]